MLRKEEVEQFAGRVAAFQDYCIKGGRGNEDISASLTQLKALREALNEVFACVVPDDRSIVKGWLLKRKHKGKASRWKRRYWFVTALIARIHLLNHTCAQQCSSRRRPALLRATIR